MPGAELTLDDYLRRNPTTGLLITHDDTILFEHYQYDRTDHDQLLSQSMAKTVTAMLIGIALSEGAIRSLDQPASDYVSGLAGTAYGETTLRNLLHMASGVAFTEVYDGADDNAKLGRQRFAPNAPGAVRAPRRLQRTRGATGHTVPLRQLGKPSAWPRARQRRAHAAGGVLQIASGSRWAPKPTQPGASIRLGSKSRAAA